MGGEFDYRKSKKVDSLQWDLITKNFTVPFKIILAGKGALRSARKYLNSAKVERGLMVVKGATHYFNDQKGMQEKIFRASERWFKKEK